jgi:hypothetical protein
MICPICGTAPGRIAWQGALICLPCREYQRVVDMRIDWKILLGFLCILLISVVLFISSM